MSDPTSDPTPPTAALDPWLPIEGSWAGHVSYQCPQCAFNALEPERIAAHLDPLVGEHRANRPLSPDERAELDLLRREREDRAELDALRAARAAQLVGAAPASTTTPAPATTTTATAANATTITTLAPVAPTGGGTPTTTTTPTPATTPAPTAPGNGPSAAATAQGAPPTPAQGV
jgi:hypothetical protein